MSWALHAKRKLLAGETVQIRPRGHSMAGKVNDGDMVTLVPAGTLDLTAGDIVLVRVGGRDYLHLIKAVSRGRFLISNNRGGTNGWVGRTAVYGKATEVRGQSGF